MTKERFQAAIYSAAVLIFLSSFLNAREKEPLSLTDVMKFRQIEKPVISSDGEYIGFLSKPDRGNAEAVIINSKGDEILRVERGGDISFTKNSEYVSIIKEPDFFEVEKDKEKEKEKELILFDLSEQNSVNFEHFISCKFSNDSRWLAISVDLSDSLKNKKEDKSAKDMLLYSIESDRTWFYKFVRDFRFDSLSTMLAFTTKDTSDNGGLIVLNIEEDKPRTTFDDTLPGYEYGEFEWSGESRLAYLKAEIDTAADNNKAELFLWDDASKKIVDKSDYPEGFYLPNDNKIRWNRESDRLFFGFRKPDKKNKNIWEKDSSNFNPEKIAGGNTLDLWHWDDPLIKTNERIEWDKKKKHLYSAIFDLEKKELSFLADENLPYIYYSESPDFFFGRTDVDYLKERTWDGRYSDFYIIDLKRGTNKRFITHHQFRVYFSPSGNYASWFEKGDWHIIKSSTGSRINITSGTDIQFSDEEHDYPSEASDYSSPGWIESDKGLFIYDRYDIWFYDIANKELNCITKGAGRKNREVYRVIKMDKKEEFISSGRLIPVSVYNEESKTTSLGLLERETGNIELKLQGDYTWKFIAKGKNSENVLVSCENYNTFPDLWLTDITFSEPKQLTNLQVQTESFLWGNPELISWKTEDGIKLDGVLIKPENYDKEKKYPVIVYFYRKYSHRLHLFNDMVLNHRPNFPYYAGQDYIIFLPDIVYEVGRPGKSAVKCIIPGIKKLIEDGIADPGKIALHGHSWGGYQTAYIVTQTDIFCCAVAGAPVSNMTSAYSGIRWGSGLARQFQYEKAQSRIGGTLWDSLDRYIENSPVFFADKINTPLMFWHGDKDDAVPWYQSIELYLAMRRLGKTSFFLQYREEPHHFRTYPNRIDFTIRMNQFFDYYCKGKKVDWIEEGIPYTGE